ncbi:MAG: DUF2062 domain-containing protein [Gammaproteobacteria bacterium]|nr:DUF2062 domain-containing protein [Gammaproteobacteria bacterium]
MTKERKATPRLDKLARLVRTRLLAPLLHGAHPPEYTARGVMFGLMIALTPTVGIQMPVVFLIWLGVRRFRPQWDFNLVVGMAWTWVTNVVTVPPVYYLYIVTGRVLLGHWDKLRDYDTFEQRLTHTLSADATWIESFWVFAVNLVEKFGVPLFVGSLPWVVLGSWLGYRWSLGFIVGFRRVRERRRRRAVARRPASGE